MKDTFTLVAGLLIVFWGVYRHKCAIARQTEQAADLISGDETV